MKGTLSSSIQENHQFFSEDPFLLSIGLASFTKSSCKIIYNQNKKYLTNVSSSLPDTLSSNQTILDFMNNLSISYTKFNVGAQQFDASKTTKTLSDIYNLINMHENVQFGTLENISESTLKAYYENISDINNSLEKCIEFVGMLEDSDFKIKLFFYSKSDRSNTRKLAIKDTINIAAVPSTPFGQKFSFGSTSSHQKSSISNYGSLIPQSRPNESYQSNFSQDSIAAPLQMFYDSSTNTFKSGNVQILARLLTDVDPAQIQSLENADFDNIEDLLSRTSGFTTGKALPLSIEQGNPHLFGPNFVECLVRNKVEIDVVNRAPRSFKKDTVVILTEINGEWIIQDFGESEEIIQPIKFGDWSFFKYIANTDSYFKDARYYTTGNDEYLRDIKPQIYEDESRKKFYTNILTSWVQKKGFIEDNIERPALIDIYGAQLQYIANMNGASTQSTFQPSINFYISTIFDQLHPDICGFNDEGTILQYVNVLDTSAFTDPLDAVGLFYKPRLFKTFWGPAYQDGFLNFKYNVKGRNNTENQTGFFGQSALASSNPEDINSYLTFFPPSAAGTIDPLAATNNRAPYLLNMPAECGSIFINPLSIFRLWDQLGQSTFSVLNPTVHSPFYGTSEPVSKNKIQFSPLYAEMVADTNPSIALRQITLKNELSITQEDNNFLGSMFLRLDDWGGFRDDNDNVVKIENNVRQEPNALGGNAVRSYDPWINSLGASSYEGAFCVGVISAKQTIEKRGGGDINLSTNQVFGRHTFDRIGGGNQTGVTIIGLGLGMTAVGFSNQLAPGSSSPTWGSRTDSVSSFGTTALHVRIFDYWPEEQTIFDPRYFGVLHFNAGSYHDSSLFVIEGETPEQILARRNNAKKLDIPIPTLKNGNIIINGRIDKDTELEVKDKWKLNPIRRGALLTGGGFKYYRHVIGVNNNTSSIVYGGTGFLEDFNYEIKSQNFSLNFKVNNGSITSWTFNQDELKNFLIGENFLPKDFDISTPIVDTNGNVIDSNKNSKGFIISVKSPTSGGKPAIIKFDEGIVYLRIERDEAPKGGTVTRLSKSSKAGSERVITGTQDTIITLEKNSSGKYDCFYHFHNDISHTLAYEYNAMPAWLQYINLTIT